MSTETKTEKAPSKKKILNKAKYAVVSAERAALKALQKKNDAVDAYAHSVKVTEVAQAALDVLLAA